MTRLPCSQLVSTGYPRRGTPGVPVSGLPSVPVVGLPIFPVTGDGVYLAALQADGVSDIHSDEATLTTGATADPNVALVLLHGRGATARSALSLVEGISREDGLCLAPQAARNTWYPQSFMAPIPENEPWLSAALDRVDTTLATAGDAGVPLERTLLVGFSQGACLASEYVARNARRYGGLAALSGGLIGPEGTPRDYEGSLAGTPAFLGCSDSDPHIPLERVHETAAVLEDLDAAVDERIYEGMGHTVNEDERAALGDLIAGL